MDGSLKDYSLKSVNLTTSAYIRPSLSKKNSKATINIITLSFFPNGSFLPLTEIM